MNCCFGYFAPIHISLYNQNTLQSGELTDIPTETKSLHTRNVRSPCALSACVFTYHATSKYSNALRTSQTCSFTKDIIFSIRRLHSKHLDRAHAVTSNLFTMLFCIPPETSAGKCFVWILSGNTVGRITLSNPARSSEVGYLAKSIQSVLT